MNSRLEALIKRGYSKEEVINLANFTDEELEYASICAFEHISRNCNPVDKPTAIFIGGQPGSGKTVMSMKLKNEIGNVIEIGIDNYRMHHPRYLRIEKCIREHWKNRKETVNDTPGNDIADFTHLFAGDMTDKLIEMAKDKKYNLLLEWGMREPSGPLNCMKTLKEKGYNNVVMFVSTYKDISYEACELRSNIMKNSNHIIRKVPKSFHDFSVQTLPESINKIYEQGKKIGIIDYMTLVTRSGKIIWDDKTNELPGTIYDNYVTKVGKNELNTNNFLMAMNTNKKEMIGLDNDITQLKSLKQDIIYMIPQLFNNNNKNRRMY